MKIQFLDYDHQLHAVENSEIRELIPYQQALISPMLKTPYTGLLAYGGKIIPVIGTHPKVYNLEASMEERPWILVLNNHARIIYGLPQWEVELSPEMAIKA